MRKWRGTRREGSRSRGEAPLSHSSGLTPAIGSMGNSAYPELDSLQLPGKWDPIKVRDSESEMDASLPAISALDFRASPPPPLLALAAQSSRPLRRFTGGFSISRTSAEKVNSRGTCRDRAPRDRSIDRSIERASERRGTRLRVAPPGRSRWFIRCQYRAGGGRAGDPYSHRRLHSAETLVREDQNVTCSR
jgi:hypothetical protein